MRYIVITIAMLVTASFAYAHLSEDDRWYIKDLQSQIRVLQNEKRELRGALSFYANRNNYQSSSLGYIIMEDEPGRRAKNAL